MYYMAEFYLPGDVDLADLTTNACAAAEELTSGGSAVRFRYAIHVREDESCFAVYDSECAESVAAAGALAGLTFDRIAEAVVADCRAP
jgi:hypothetical protein